jgi:hypothetical protein
LKRLGRRKTLMWAAAAAAALACGSLADAFWAADVTSASERPCDIYASGGTPCVAAYSTVRALYHNYDGPLYQVTRASDDARANIGVLRPGGFADAAVQDAFCWATVCTITRIYDQSPEHNDLGIAVTDFPANASALPVTVDGHHVYGLYIQPGDGYRNYVTRGVAVGSQPQGAYMVTSAVDTNDRCCFDFGNAETPDGLGGAGHMDAISFTSLRGAGADPNSSGPWVQADLENGLFASNGAGPGSNAGITDEFVTAIVNSNGSTMYDVKDGNAQSGGLTTDYSGPLPDLGGYVPLKQEGSIVLGTGGDNSNQSSGFFFEGVLTAGFPSAATDNHWRRRASRRRREAGRRPGGSRGPENPPLRHETLHMVLDRFEPGELAKVDQMRVRAGPALQEPGGFPHPAEPVHVRHRRRGHETAVRSQEVVERSGEISVLNHFEREDRVEGVRFEPEVLPFSDVPDDVCGRHEIETRDVGPSPSPGPFLGPPVGAADLQYLRILPDLAEEELQLLLARDLADTGSCLLGLSRSHSMPPMRCSRVLRCQSAGSLLRDLSPG